MLIDEYIAALTKLRQTYGAKLEVLELSAMGGTLRKATLPRIGHVQKDNPRRLFKVSDLDRNKGDRVVLVNVPAAMGKAEMPKDGVERFASMNEYNRRLGKGQV